MCAPSLVEGNPAGMVRLRDGRICLTYGYPTKRRQVHRRFGLGSRQGRPMMLFSSALSQTLRWTSRWRHWAIACFLACCCPQQHANADNVKWVGTGQYRILIEVAATGIGDRATDEMVARCELDWCKLFPGIPADRLVDLHTLQVIKYSSRTGEPEMYDGNHYARSPFDRHFRFYDKSLLDEFPTWRRYASLEAEAGRSLHGNETLSYGHRVFNPVGDGKLGTLVWAHTQHADRSSYYGIYFDLLREGEPPLSPPVGFVGDGGNRVVKESTRSGPPGNNAGCVADWNNDGLYDVIYGMSSGYLVVLENTGTHNSPEFRRRRLLLDTDGKPIDTGYDSCPHVTDWNGDGKKDLLVGAEKGCILFFENRGTDRQPLLAQSGFVQADEQMLLTPNWPIVELADKPRGSVFKWDYVAIPFAVDWDGDGDLDLLVGGFVTGLVFYFENVGTRANGTPQLEARGPLQADNQPIDTAWAAAPFAVDIDNDGDLDLICGAKAMTAQGGDVSDPRRNLYYFKNTGTRKSPRLSHRDFPMSQPPPTGTTLMASVVDWNRDGLLDLGLIGRSSMQTFFVRNIGSKSKPLFDMDVKPIAGHWTNGQLSPGAYLDWNKDGHPDLIARFNVLLNSGKGMPGFFERRVNLLAGSKSIRHPVPHGDENSSVVCFDFDSDGDHDCLYGAHSGYIWYHQNQGSNDKPDWDTNGYRLPLASGGVIKVGLPEGDEPKNFDFTALQGARPKLAPDDFNRDGLTDLVVGDTFGSVRYFENVGTKTKPSFADPVVLFERAARLNVVAADWNSDAWPDVLVVMGNGVFLLESKAIKGKCEFHPERQIELPATIGNIYSVSMVDYNRDGDTDILYNSSSRMTCFVESSFSRFGYRDAQLIRAQQRPTNSTSSQPSGIRRR